jgi:hypothetical protein
VCSLLRSCAPPQCCNRNGIAGQPARVLCAVTVAASARASAHASAHANAHLATWLPARHARRRTVATNGRPARRGAASPSPSIATLRLAALLPCTAAVRRPPGGMVAAALRRARAHADGGYAWPPEAMWRAQRAIFRGKNQ